MDASLLDVALAALSVLLEPERLFYLGMGTVIGLALGIMPGVGGVAGLALLLPFTFNLDAYSAFAFMLGLGAVTSTSDTIPAVYLVCREPQLRKQRFLMVIVWPRMEKLAEH